MIQSSQVVLNGNTPVAIAIGPADVRIRLLWTTSVARFYLGDATVSAATGFPVEQQLAMPLVLTIKGGDTLYAISNLTSLVAIGVLLT